MHERKCRIDELTGISSCGNMSQCLFYMYSVSYNMKQRAYLVRSSSVAKVFTRKTRTIDIPNRSIIITAYSILSF